MLYQTRQKKKDEQINDNASLKNKLKKGTVFKYQNCSTKKMEISTAQQKKIC